MARSVKFVYQGMLRRLGVETVREPSGRVTIASLQEHVQSLFPALKTHGDARHIAFTYADEAGDVCTVTTDAELEEAFRVVKDLELAVLRLDVVLMEAPLPPGGNTAPVELEQEEETLVVHPNVICDGCEMAPLRGPRFHCTVRADYDLCPACEAKDASGFSLIKIKDPSQKPTSTGGQGTPIICGGGGKGHTPALGLGGEMAENPWPVVGALAQRVRLEGAASLREFGPFLAWRKPNGTLVLQHPAPGGVPLTAAAATQRSGPCWKAGGCARIGPKGCVDFHGCGGPFASFHVEKLSPAGGGGARAGGRVRLLTANRKWRLAAMGGKLVGVPALEMGQHTVFTMHPDEEDAAAAPSGGGGYSQGEIWADGNDEAAVADRETPEWQALQAVAEADTAAEALAQATKVKAAQQAARAAEEPPQATPPPQACFLADVTVPDGTVVAPGETFRKMWRLRNDGDAPLPEARLVWCGGAFGGPSQGGPNWGVPVPAVPPCAEFEIGVWLTAPVQVPNDRGGLARSYWRLEGVDSGKGFGHRLWAEVRVVDPEATTTTAATSEAQTTAAAAAPPSEKAAAAAPEEEEEVGQMCTFPVELSEGGRLTISWRRGEVPETVGLRFLTSHGLSVDQVPDVAAFVRRAEASLPPVKPAPPTNTTATTKKSAADAQSSSPSKEEGSSAVEQIAQKRAELKAEKRAAIAAQAFDRANAIKGQLSALNAQAAIASAPPPSPTSCAAEEKTAPTQGGGSGAAAAATRVVSFKELAPHSTQAREYLKPVPGCGAVAKAWYGDPKHPWSPKHGKDVTDRVTHLLTSGPPYGPACNARLGGDPVKGVRKRLFVEFFLLEDTTPKAAPATQAVPEAAPAEAAPAAPAPVAAIPEQVEAPAAASEVAPPLPVHPRVVCDRSGMSPIVGVRYSVPGANYDLCAAEFDKLDAIDRPLYVAIAHPGAQPVPCGLVAECAEAPRSVDAPVAAATLVEQQAPAEPAAVAAASAAAPGDGKVAGEDGFVESEVGRLEGRPTTTTAPETTQDEEVTAAEAGEVEQDKQDKAAPSAQDGNDDEERVAEQERTEELARWQAHADADAAAVVRAVAVADAAVAEAVAQSWGGSQATPPSDGTASATFSMPGSDDEGDGSAGWEHVEACPSEDADLALSAEVEEDVTVEQQEEECAPPVAESAVVSAEAPDAEATTVSNASLEGEVAAPEEEANTVFVEENELEASFEGAALAGSHLQAASNNEGSDDGDNNGDLTASVSAQLATAASNEAFEARLAEWSDPVGKVMELGFDDVSVILDALARRCPTPQDFHGHRAQQVVDDLLSNMPSVQ